jgi:hypothetical protein
MRRTFLYNRLPEGAKGSFVEFRKVFFRPAPILPVAPSMNVPGLAGLNIDILFLALIGLFCVSDETLV